MKPGSISRCDKKMTKIDNRKHRNTGILQTKNTSVPTKIHFAPWSILVEINGWNWGIINKNMQKKGNCEHGYVLKRTRIAKIIQE